MPHPNFNAHHPVSAAIDLACDASAAMQETDYGVPHSTFFEAAEIAIPDEVELDGFAINLTALRAEGPQGKLVAEILETQLLAEADKIDTWEAD